MTFGTTLVLILFGLRRNYLRVGRSRSLYISIRRVIKKECRYYRGISLLSTMYKIFSNILLSRVTPYAEEITKSSNVDFDATDQLLTIYSALFEYLRKNRNTMKQCIRYLQTSRKLMFQLRGRFCIIFLFSFVSP